MKPHTSRRLRSLRLLACALVVLCGGLLLQRAPVPDAHARTPTPIPIQTPTPSPAHTPTPPPARTPAPAPAQTTPTHGTAQTPAPHADSDVKLDVFVSDESNRHVANLRREDFRVEVNGAPQTITFFAEESPALSYSLLVDNTGSMRTVFDEVLRTGAMLVAGKNARDEMSVVRFVSRERIELMSDFTRSQNALAAALDEMYVEGGHTALLEALYVAAEAVVARAPNDVERKRALVVITDGGERDPRSKLEEVLTYLRRHNVPVFVFGLTEAMRSDDFREVKGGRRGARELLETLARETGGHAVFPKKLAEFADAALALNARLQMPRYTLAYAPTHAEASNQPRKIEVKLADSLRKDERQPRLLVSSRVRGATAGTNAPARK